MKVKNQYLKIIEYLPSIQYKLWVSLVIWNRNNGEHCWLGNGPEDDHWGSQRVITERGGCSRNDVSKYIKCKAKLTGRKKLSRKMCTSNRDDRKLENTVKQSRFKHLRELHKEWTEDGVSASRFHLEIKVPESGGRVERHRIHVAWSPGCFHSQWWFGLSCHLLVLVQCFLKSTVNAAIYQDIWEHFLLPSDEKLYGDADFIFQQDLATAHTAKVTKSWSNDHGVTVLDWPANSPDLNPIENLWGIVKRKMRDTRPNNADDMKAAIKATWASITPEQYHRLIASMSRRIDAVIHAKGGQTKYWVHRIEHTFQKPDISV